MIWSFLTFLIRKLDPETAHQLTLKVLQLGFHPRLKSTKITTKINNLTFKNILGVAAGFDKNAQVISKIHFFVICIRHLNHDYFFMEYPRRFAKYKYI